jgi:uncharacterized protein
MIMATKIPQQPKNHLEEIICDADLDYLGTDDYPVISKTLFKEMEHLRPLTETRWLEIQVGFLEAHHYFTATATKARKRKKEATLQRLKRSLQLIQKA